MRNFNPFARITPPTGKTLSQNAIAGLSIAGLLLPEAVAYSTIANLPPQAGIIALFAGLICYGLLGNSRFAIVSATSSSAVVLAAATATIAGDDVALRLILAMGLVLLSGLFFIIAALLRLGSITDFIAKPVLRGFAFGLALVIVIKQWAIVVDIHPTHSDLFSFIPELLTQYPQWNLVGIATGLLSLLLLFIFSRIRHVPAGLLVIALGIAASHWLNLPHYGIKLVGEIHLQLQTPNLPALSRADWLKLGELAFALTMVLYSESYGSIRNFAIKHGDTVSANRDLFALGSANVLSALFHGMPVGAGYSATAANEAAGASSRLAGLFSAVVLFAIVVLLLPAIALTPEPVLAAIVMHAVSHTLNLNVFRNYFIWRRDRVVIVAATLGVLLLGVLDGLLAAIALSLMMLLKRLSQSSVMELGRLGDSHDFVNLQQHSDATTISGVLILRPLQPLFFANADRVLRQARLSLDAIQRNTHTVILSLEETPDIDGSTLESLHDFVATMQQQGKHLIITRLKSPAYQLLQQSFPTAISHRSITTEKLSTISQGQLIISELSVGDAVQLVGE